jgi:hypothetical protein
MIADAFATRGLLEAGERNIVRFRYMRDADETGVERASDGYDIEDDVSTAPQWKSRYCTWTHLGDWLSDECYSAHSDVMVLKNEDARRAKIDELLAKGKDKSWVQERKGIFLGALVGVWDDLAERQVPPDDYLNGGTDGINLGYYNDRFDKKLLTDYRLALDRDFYDRYVYGYEFPAVPRFRQDTESWNNFVRSWCESVALEAVKNKNTPR